MRGFPDCEPARCNHQAYTPFPENRNIHFLFKSTKSGEVQSRNPQIFNLEEDAGLQSVIID